MTANGCVHLDVFKTPESLKTYRVVHAVFVVCATADARKTKLRSAICHTCRRRGPFMHACLHCVFFGCQRHIREHCQRPNTPMANNNNENGHTPTETNHNNNNNCLTLGNNKHAISMELGYGQIHCSSCGDYVYDAELDAVAMRNKFEAGICKKRLFSWTSFIPTTEERELFKYNPKRICLSADSTRGLRGLLNLGATCFMNSIVQALIHTPLLRDYFLAERHKCAKTVCLVCELARLFQEFYRGVHIPLALDRMLYLLWTHAHHLAAYDQQDAHECFIATLDLLHLHCVDPDTPTTTTLSNNPDIDTNTSSATHTCNKNNGSLLDVVGGTSGILFNGSGGSDSGSGCEADGTSVDCIAKCPCIIDQIFTGGLQSDLVCQTCRGISTKIDPIWDISLELNAVTVEGLPLCTLTQCLEVFTRAEKLTSNVHCVSCQSSEETTKRLTLKTLPIVVSIHLKRFEHTVDDTTSKKISTLISFPETLDMTPFMSDTQEQKNYPTQQKNKLSNRATIPSNNRYSLFAVVSHSGTIHSGHYIAYVRQQRDYWYTCDDHVITRTTLKDVLASEGYLLFYHKHTLDYD